MAKVTFLPDNKECNAPSNVTLLEVAKGIIFLMLQPVGVKVIALHVDC